MKKVRITRYTPPVTPRTRIVERFWRVHVNRKDYYFGSERTLLLWLGDLNRHLNDLMHDLNHLTGEISSEYRSLYFHLPNSSCAIISARMASIDQLFNLMVNRYDTPNGNSFTYQRFERIMADLARVLEEMQKQELVDQNTVLRYRLRNLNGRLLFCQNMLQWVPHYEVPKLLANVRGI